MTGLSKADWESGMLEVSFDSCGQDGSRSAALGRGKTQTRLMTRDRPVASFADTSSGRGGQAMRPTADRHTTLYFDPQTERNGATRGKVEEG